MHDKEALETVAELGRSSKAVADELPVLLPVQPVAHRPVSKHTHCVRISALTFHYSAALVTLALYNYTVN